MKFENFVPMLVQPSLPDNNVGRCSSKIGTVLECEGIMWTPRVEYLNEEFLRRTISLISSLLSNLAFLCTLRIRSKQLLMATLS